MVIKVMGKNGAWCTCEECSKLFYRPKCHIGEYNQFCSRECWIIWEGSYGNNRQVVSNSEENEERSPFGL